jgi:hypothetical protein
VSLYLTHIDHIHILFPEHLLKTLAEYIPLHLEKLVQRSQMHPVYNKNCMAISCWTVFFSMLYFGTRTPVGKYLSYPITEISDRGTMLLWMKGI